ncbi:MAG: T9SS type A sorting domain-containing protein, partial [Candidatus Latescibacteria bacterium]|nr:T9SS type A sorting domain-containing protein [Candidatus Latescibacterota bacterium]
TVYYEFDNSELTIPIQITGTPANAMLLVFTKDKAESISHVHNGYLGWHYVNKIDTCVYMSEPANYDVGKTTIKWSGKDNDGGIVPAGEYTYYIWGFDNVTFKIPLTRQVNPQPWGKIALVTHDEDGTPKNNPYFIQSSAVRPTVEQTPAAQKNKKWIIGSDPDDSTLVETCVTYGGTDRGETGIDPTNHSNFFKAGNDNNNNTRCMAWIWVPNGDAEKRTDWGDEGEFAFSIATGPRGDWGPGVVSDGGDYLLMAKGDLLGGETESEIVYVDLEDGEEIQRLDIADWYVSLDDAEAGGQSSTGPANFSVWNGKLMTGAHGTCMNVMLDIYWEDEDEAVVWANDNGDYTGDHNFEETSEKPWVCNDYNVGPYKYNFPVDDKGFSCFPSFDMGAVSFGLFAPDGTGLGYHALAGETAAQKYDTEIIAYDSPYDGYMVSNQSAETDKVGYFWVGQDTFQGVITNVPVAVEEEAPAAFAVAQNSPNPFNPTTTINFNIAEAGNVAVDVFNVAGQKVDTIAHEFMSAGNHSVTWDASAFSAGVYFYSVKSGDFSKTMKMTLLK